MASPVPPSPSAGRLCDNMKHPNSGTECFEFNLSKAFSLRCVHSRYTVCGGCESCILTKRITSVKTWFSKAGDRSRRRFMLGLIRRLHSADLVCHVVQLLQPLLYKDFTYARTRTKPSLQTDQATTSDDRALSLIILEKDITNTWYWFETTNYWTKCNFLLAILQECEAHLLHAIGTLAKTLFASEHCAATLGSSSDDTLSLASTNYTFSTAEHPELNLLISARSEYSILDKVPLESPWNKQVVTTPEQGAIVDDIGDDGASVDLNELDPTCMVVPTSEKAYSGVSRYKDFIRQLPVHLSKYILSWLDQVSLYNCVCVSRHWRILVEEVHNEFYVNQHLWEEVMLMQGAAGQSSNPLYAKDTDVYVPNVIPATWRTIRTDESMIETMFKSEVNFTTAYSGYSTRKIIMEERNVYCGAYNVMMLMDQEQANETTAMHTDGGEMIAFGCLDRKIHFLSSMTGKPMDMTISGHAGSIRCLAIDEKKGIIVSGSYDTSLRGWSLETGRCEKIYRGHNDTVTCVEICGDKMASGARDNFCKVWHLETGQCEHTFKHKHAISAIAFSSELCICGCDSGNVTVWDVKSGQIVKKLTGHHNVVTGIKFDQWHIVTGSKDGYALAWSAQGDHTRCLTALRHTREVLCLEFMYLRVITGSADGKLRIWNMLNGQCLRIMRGNSKSDPIYRLIAIGNRITVNTCSNMLMLHFEQVKYDYTLENDKTPALVQYSKYSETPIRPQPYSYIRAQRMLKAGASNTKIVHHTFEDKGAKEVVRLATQKRCDQMTHSAKGLSSQNMASAQRIHSAGPRLQTSARQGDRRPLMSEMPPVGVNVSAKSVTILPRPTHSIGHTHPRAQSSGHAQPKAQSSTRSSTVHGIRTGDDCYSNDEDSKGDTRRRVSWAFEHPRIPRCKKLRLNEVKSLLRSQMRIRGKPVPPDFVYLSINAIQASMKPTEATANMQLMKREEELRYSRHLGRPVSSPGMIDPRTKVPVEELHLDQMMIEHGLAPIRPSEEKREEDSTDWKPQGARGGADDKGRVKMGGVTPVAAIIDTEYRSTPVTTRPHMSLYKKSIPSSIPEARILRPHTATLRCPTPEPGVATTRMLRKAKQASLRGNISKVTVLPPRRKLQPTQTSPDAMMVPMLMYSPNLSAKIEDLRQHQRQRQEALLVSPDGKGKVSKYNDPMRSHVTFTLRTHQQVEQELVAIATRRDLDERKSTRRFEKQQRAAWLAKVKGCDMRQFTEASQSYVPEIGKVA